MSPPTEAIGLLDLPPEILTSILLLTSPQDASAVSRTCSHLYTLIGDDAALWRNLFLDRWDPPSSSRRGDERLDAAYARLVKERARATERLTRGGNDEVAKLLHYNSVLRPLWDVVKDLLPRDKVPGQYNLQGPPSASVNTLKRLFPYHDAGDRLFADLIYPRETVAAYSAWKETGASLSQAAGKLRDAQEMPEAEQVPLATDGGAMPTPSKRRAVARPRRASSPRRSRRLLKAALPESLRHLLDDGGASDARDVWELEGLTSPLDEERAAEIHCLHGARYWFCEQDRKNLAERDGLLERKAQGPDLTEGEHERLQALLLELPLDPAEYDHRERRAPFRAGRGESTLLLGSRQGRIGDMRLRGQARSRVYDCQGVGFQNAWAPLKAFRDREMPPEPVEDASDDEQGEEASVNSADSESQDGADEDGSGDGSGDGGGDADSDDSSFHGDLSDVEIQEGSDDDLIDDAINLEAPDGDGDDDSEDGDNDDVNMLGQDFEMTADGNVTDGGTFARSLLHVLRKVTGRRIAESARRRRADGEAGLEPKWEEGIDPLTGLKRWRTRKQIDWRLVEALMVVTHACLVSEAAREWSMSLAVTRTLPFAPGWPSDLPPLQDEERILRRALWALMLPSGWATSRGEQGPRQGAQPSGDEAGAAAPVSPDRSVKPRDWAHVEGFWISMYSYLDFKDYLKTNVVRGCLEHEDVSWPAGMHRPKSEAAASLERMSEVTPESLCIEFELRPQHEQKPEFEEGEEQAWYDGPEDDEFPTLRFTGRTVLRLADRTVESAFHGYVRPIRDPPIEADGHSRPGPVSGLHFSLTHSDNEERWRLEAIQPGPPGSRCPFYGIWTEQEHGRASPNGPSSYWRIDDRSAREITEMASKNPVDREATLLRLANHLGVIQ